MIIYLTWFVISIVFLFATIKSNRRTQNVAMAFFMVALGVFVGLGDMLGGYDRYIYGELYDRMADVTRSGGNPLTSDSFAYYGTEFGYGTFCALISYITGNRYIFILIATMVIYTLLIVSLQKYVDNTPFAVVMFMGLWFFFTFTYLRQVIGCTICWLSIRYIIERRLLPFLLVLFIAYSFHNSAIVFFPIYFFPIKKYPRQLVIDVMIAAFLIGLTPIPQGLFAAYGDVNSERVGASGYEMDAGFRWAYLIEAVFFLSVILSNYNNISNKVKDLAMLNIALVFCAILLIFIRSENGGRLGWMFMIGVICTMSNVCVKKRQVLSHGVILILVCLFLYIRIYNSWQPALQLYPYKTFLTDGYREGDPVHEKFEYDFKYDEDKFYRPAFGW